MAAQTQLSEFIKGISDFSTEFHKQCSDTTTDSIIVSPLAVATVLTLLSEGANGETFDELRRGLHLSDDKVANANNFYEFYKLLVESIGKSTLTTATRVYVGRDFEINQEFKAIAVQNYSSDIQAVDFSDSDATANMINKFVEENTNEKIKNLIEPSMLGPLTRMVLVNAIYFKGNWEHKFNKRDTRKGNFYINETDRCSVDFMAINEEFNYCKLADLNATALEMKYADSNLSFVILLPNSRTGLTKLESVLCNYDLAKITQKMYRTDVRVMVPKFKVEFELKLNDLLKKMGIVKMFDEDNANLDGLSALPPPSYLYVSHVVHKAFIEVNEEGSEAGAAAAAIEKERELPPSFHAKHL